jgi:hypothetical protein
MKGRVLGWWCGFGMGWQRAGVCQHWLLQPCKLQWNSTYLHNSGACSYSDVRTNSDSRVTVVDNVGFTVSPCPPLDHRSADCHVVHGCALPQLRIDHALEQCGASRDGICSSCTPHSAAILDQKLLS